MPFFKHRSKAPGELALHETALNSRIKEHPLPLVQQVQRNAVHPPTPRAQEIVEIPSAPLFIGNVFQEGITELPVMNLSGHHLSRLPKLEAQRPKDSSSPNGEKRLRKENKRAKAKEKMEKIKKTERMEKSGSIGEHQPPTTDIITHTTSISSPRIRKTSRAKLQKYITCTSFRKLFKKWSKKSPANKVREKFEEEVDSHIETAAEMTPLFVPDTTTFTNDPNWPLH